MVGLCGFFDLRVGLVVYDGFLDLRMFLGVKGY